MSSSAEGSNRQGPLPQAGGVLHQRRGIPYCPAKMAVGGFLIIATIGYFTLGIKAKPGTTPSEVIKVVGGSGAAK